MINKTSHAYDLEFWKPNAVEYSEYFLDKNRSRFKGSFIKSIKLKKWKVRELYSLISCVLHTPPNGMMTSLITEKPMNSLWWWDFAITNHETMLNIMCSNSKVEIFSYSLNQDFDIEEFLTYNMDKYKNFVNAKIESLEIHEGYINHYKSYKRINEYLHSELKKLNCKKPEGIKRSYKEGESDKLLANLDKYHKDSIKLHALGKSLILNSAFMAESYLNTIIRVGYKFPYDREKTDIKEYSRYNFEDRIKNLHKLCRGFYVEIDTSVEPIKDMLEIMTLRNKYTHADLSSEINKLTPAYFDGDYPLIENRNGNYIIDSIESTYHNPSRDKIFEYYKKTIKFIEYMESILPSKYKEMYAAVLELEIITRNKDTHNYSLIFQPEAAISLMIG